MPETRILDWIRHAIFYEVYPQTFFDTNGDGIGDLEGVIRKLDYIRDTGATAI
jgi:alpha-glucosidase